MKKQAHSFQSFLAQSELLSQTDQANVKGGRRYVTTSYSKFAAKRDSLQQQGACMCITHIGDTYCIEY
ncbi:MAG: hypothetical protein AB8G22_14285 [Saprospiraceae bacterium]